MLKKELPFFVWTKRFHMTSSNFLLYIFWSVISFLFLCFLFNFCFYYFQMVSPVSGMHFRSGAKMIQTLNHRKISHKQNNWWDWGKYYFNYFLIKHLINFFTIFLDHFVFQLHIPIQHAAVQLNHQIAKVHRIHI